MNRRDTIIIFLALLIGYCYVLPRWADWSQNSRLNLTRALVEQRTTQIDAYVANTGDYAEYKGHDYTDKAPGPSIVGVPLYAAVLPIIDQPAVASKLERLAGGGALAGTLNPNGTGLKGDKVRQFVAQFLLTVVTVAIPAAALGVLLYLVLARMGFSRGVRLLVTLGYGLATPALAYSGNFYSHQFVAALLFGAFFILLDDRRPTTDDPLLTLNTTMPTRDRLRSWWAAGGGPSSVGWARALLIGLCCGFAVISEYPMALVAGVLGLVALVRLPMRQVGWIILGGLLPVALMVVYDVRAFGTITPIGYAYSKLWQNQHHTGFMSITYPKPEAIWGLTFSLYRGFFVRAPWLLAAIPGFVIWWRARTNRTAWWVSLASVVSLTLFYASSLMWWGGFGVSSRYLVPILPFMALAAAFGVDALWSSLAKRAGMIALVLLSAGLTWAETVAHQGFPPDTIFEPWLDYTLPAWMSGDIARNFGMVLGLRGTISLLPLVVLLVVLIGLLLVPRQAVVEPKSVSLESPTQNPEPHTASAS